jgi:methyl-accepting chemotaxis protein
MIMNIQKRRTYYIEKKFQTKYILLTIFLLLAYTFAFIIIIFSPYILTLYFDFYSLSEKADAARTLLILHAKVWPGIAGIILLFGALSIFITHKIAGPLYRLKKTISEIINGNLDVKVKLRKNDDLKDLAEHVNMLAEELKTFVNTVKVDYDLLSEYILELEREIDAKMITEESGRKIIKKVQNSRKNIEVALDKFKIQR